MKRFFTTSLLIILSIVSANSWAKATCPAAKDILTSAAPAGQFAKTMWQLAEAKHRLIDISDSILIFSEESIENEKLLLKGYFWWRRDKKVIGCAQLKGAYEESTRKLLLTTLNISSVSIPSKAVYSAILSEDKNTLLRFTIRGKDINKPYLWFFEGGGSPGGKWQAIKIYP
ncbi:MAG: hypothetical protein HN764_05840 [Gammaproteobacteria bacterium]|nr:hypothetical protein [Gammaproteobacteria bacterium]